MASRIYLYFFVSGGGFGRTDLIFYEVRGWEPFEELDLELLRGRSFSFFALLLKKLKVLSISCYDDYNPIK